MRVNLKKKRRKTKKKSGMEVEEKGKEGLMKEEQMVLNMATPTHQHMDKVKSTPEGRLS